MICDFLTFCKEMTILIMSVIRYWITARDLA